MAELHFEEYPYHQNLFGVNEGEVQGKFEGWKENAKYSVEMTVVIQIDTTNISAEEYDVSPNITFLSTNQAIVNIYKLFSFSGSWLEFQEWYQHQEQSLQHYVTELEERLNNARQSAGLMGSWYVNYSLDERKITVYKVG